MALGKRSMKPRPYDITNTGTTVEKSEVGLVDKVRDTVNNFSVFLGMMMGLGKKSLTRPYHISDTGFHCLL